MTKRPTARSPSIRSKNRFAAALCHVNRYTGNHTKILSHDTGVPPHRLHRIIKGVSEPSYIEALRIVEAISTFAGRAIPPTELVTSMDEDFPTTYPCALFDCCCHPPWAYNEADEVRPEFKSIPQGQWTLEVPNSR